jgi:carbon-monoxide dehydrogenase small subunit
MELNNVSSQKLHLTVNMREYFLTVDPKDSLLTILRERLNLTGTKNGCSQSHCGACTVVVNGEAVRSCMKRAKDLNDTKIVTIEGISSNYKLHAIQKALIETAAVQCGFCIPGYIMELYALFSDEIDASEERIRTVLEDHLCRCTGYEPILKGALLAQKMIKERL